MKTLLNRANKVLSPVLSHYSDLEIASAKGIYLIDPAGQKYLDFATGIGVTSTGHCHPQVTRAIKKQADNLIHACAGIVYYEPNIALAEKLGQILGHNLNSVFFTQSGSETIEACIKLAKFATKKQHILAFQGAFHGRTLGALSITTSKARYQEGYLPLLSGVHYFPYPYCYRCPFGKKDSKKCGQACFKNLDKILQKISPNLAAVIIEPILGEGGYVVPPLGFLKNLRALCDKYKVLLIFDEIQTGFAKTGSWFAFQKKDVTPDIIGLAKAIASGLPLGACVASSELMAKWTPGAHGGTYGGNPVCCASGLATIEVLKKALPKIPVLAKTTQTFLQKELKNYPYLGDIRAEGLMIGLEFVKDKNTKEPYPELVKKIMKTARENKLIIISCGIHDNVIRLIPPLIISKTELLKGLNLLKKAIYATN